MLSLPYGNRRYPDTVPMLHAKFQDHRTSSSGEVMFLPLQHHVANVTKIIFIIPIPQY